MDFHPPVKNWQDINILQLAYLGDAVYELWVRQHLLAKGIGKLEEMHKNAVHYVQARTQAAILKSLLPELNETETAVVMRGRNAKGNHPRNVDVLTYRHATAFEALVGYWYLGGQQQRMQTVFDRIDDIIRSLPSNAEEK